MSAAWYSNFVENKPFSTVWVQLHLHGHFWWCTFRSLCSDWLAQSLLPLVCCAELFSIDVLLALAAIVVLLKCVLTSIHLRICVTGNWACDECETWDASTCFGLYPTYSQWTTTKNWPNSLHTLGNTKESMPKDRKVCAKLRNEFSWWGTFIGINSPSYINTIGIMMLAFTASNVHKNSWWQFAFALSLSLRLFLAHHQFISHCMLNILPRSYFMIADFLAILSFTIPRISLVSLRLTLSAVFRLSISFSPYLASPRFYLDRYSISITLTLSP